jgi:hypothetical protein
MLCILYTLLLTTELYVLRTLWPQHHVIYKRTIPRITKIIVGSTSNLIISPAHALQKGDADYYSTFRVGDSSQAAMGM